MYKIVFVIGTLDIGGVQTSLINLLNKIDYEKFDVSLIAFSIEESYRKLIPEKVKIIRMPKVLELINTPSVNVRKKGKIVYAIRKFLALCCKLFSADFVYSVLFAFVNTRKLSFDAAISYTNNVNIKSVYFGSNKFVLKKIKAKKKFSWLHVDYKAMNISNKTNNREYAAFDKIICVSKDTEKKFLECCPEFENKTCVIYNIVDTESIREKSLENIDNLNPGDEFKLVTVCRLDKNKNVDDCIRTASLLKEKGLDFKWLIVGDGPERKKLEVMAQEYGVGEQVMFLGYQSNPYVYMKKSDIYVSTSISESFGLSIYESLILGKTVVARRYDAVEEVIRGEEDGIIVSGSEKEFCSAIMALNERISKNDRNVMAYEMFVEERNRQALIKLEELINA